MAETVENKFIEIEKAQKPESETIAADPDFIMSPKVDFCFKELMQEPNIRKGFIAALLDVDPESITRTTVLDTNLERQSETDKLGILDVLVEMEDHTRIDLEMQVAYFAYWTNRILYYMCRMYSGQLKKGQSYDELKKCIHVSILDFIHFKNTDQCMHRIHLRDDSSNRLYTDLLEFQILELPKLSKSNSAQEGAQSAQDIAKEQGLKNPSNSLNSWMRFFNGKTREDFASMAAQNRYMEEAYQKLQELSADERKRIEYEAREKAIRDYNTQVKSYYNQGIREGKSLGFEKGKKITLIQMMIKKMQKGKNLEMIAEELEQDIEAIRGIYEVIQTCGRDCDVETVFEKMNR